MSSTLVASQVVGTDIGYTLIILLAITSAFVVSRFTQTSLDLPTVQKLKLGLGGFMGAMLGAKIPFLFADWNDFLSGATWFSSGKTILTGLAGGYLGVELTKRLLNVSTKTGDSFVIPVAVAIGIGRWGCFYAGCCYGIPTGGSFGVVFEVIDDQLRHPTQIYESIFHLGFAGLAMWMGWRKLCIGNRFKFYLVAYSVYRFLTEWLRPEERFFGGLTTYQYASLAMIAIFGWLWIRDDGVEASERHANISSNHNSPEITENLL